MAFASSSSSPPRARSHNQTLYRTRSSSVSLSSGFASSTAPLIWRSSSPTRLSMYARSASSSSSRSARFAVSRPISPRRRSISVQKQPDSGSGNGSGTVSIKKKMCMCSPTTHPGSFRCAMHKNSPRGGRDQTPSSHSNGGRLNLIRTAMKNSLVRIGGVEGELVKRALSALIRPSSHQQRRRDAFKPRPSRLSVMSRAEDS